MEGQYPETPCAGWSLSLILPAYNEESVIRQAIEEADEVLAGLARDYEILVVDDGSQDGTAAAVSEAASGRPHVRLLSHAENRGYGAALRTGFEAARFDRVAFTDADCQFDLTDLAYLVPLADHYPVVSGYRLDRKDTPKRRFFSWGYNVLVRTLLGTRVRDCDCALKVFRKEALGNLLPETSGFFVNTEMLTRARQRGYQVTEAPVQHRPRLRGASKVTLADIPRTLATLLPFWWSRVLFPASGPAPARQGNWLARNGELATLVLLLVAGLLFFSRLRSPLLEPDEARYAEIPRQMLAEGRWIVPVLHGEPYYHKPPLLYWLVMASYQVFGVNDWAARLVPCGSAFLVVLLTFFWGQRTLGPRAAFAGALVLCLSGRFVYLGRMLTMDGLLCLWVVGALASAHLALRGPVLGRRWWLVSACACGLGFLTKGPVALALVLVPVGACQLLDPRLARLRWRHWLGYLGVTAAVAGPWYVAMLTYAPGFAGDFFWTHNLVRYVHPIDHEEPAWFFLPGLILGMLPWTLLLPAFVKFLARRSAVAAARRPACLGYFLVACLWCLSFYSAAGCKRVGYILPAMPPLALALGLYLDVVLPHDLLRRTGVVLARRRAVLANRATLLVLAVGISVSLLAVAVGLQKPARGIAPVIAASGGLWCVYRYGPGWRVGLTWGLCGVATFAVLFVGVQQVLPGYARKFSLRRQVEPQVEVSEAHVPVVCYPHRWDSVSFYLRRNDVRSFPAERRDELMADLQSRPDTLVFVKSERFLDELVNHLPGSLEFVPRGLPGTVTAGLVRRRPEAGPAW